MSSSKILYVIFFVIFIWMLGFALFLSKISHEKIELNERADAIIVLTGAKGRIDAGLQLLSFDYGKHLFISGVGQNVPLKDLSKFLSSFSSDYVETLKSSITLDHFADSTEGNAIESMEWIKNNGYKKIILVTSNYHMPRSLRLFKNSMPNIEIIPYPVVNNINYQQAFLEYNKFLVCLIK